MSFIERKIDVQIQLSGDTFDGSSNTLLLQGLRCQATIANYSGGLGSFGSVLQMSILGMRGADMSKLSTMGYKEGLGWKRNVIEVFAGDDANGMSLIFMGAIASGTVNYNNQPDVSVQLMANAIFNEKMTVAAASSYKGDMDVSVMLQGLAHAAGWAFKNSGVTTKLSNHVSTGTIPDQIEDICLAANIRHTVQPGPTRTLIIWPPGGTKDNTVIEVSPQTGMVGYPEYAMNSIYVTSEFNPNIEFGRNIKIVTSIPNLNSRSQQNFGRNRFPGDDVATGADGTYYCWNVTHDISSQMPGGPWFTRAQLGVDSTSAHNQNV